MQVQVQWLGAATKCCRAKLLHPAQARLFRALALVILAIQLCNVDGGRDGCEYGNDIGAAVAIGEDCGMKTATLTLMNLG